MDAQSVRTALGTLQNSPDDSEAWQDLRDVLMEEGGDLDRASALALLEAALERHAARGEAEAVVRLLDLCADQCRGTALEVTYLRRRASVLLDELFAGLPAIATLARASSLPQADATLQQELEVLQARARAWKDQAAKYHAEADSAPDDLYRSAMIMRAAEVEICFSEEPRASSIVENLEMALRLDPSNLPASRLLEVIYRRTGDTAGSVRVLERTADRAPDPEARLAAGIRLGRHFQHVLRDEERAAAVFDRVLESDPSNPDAMAFVTEYYAKTENWDALVKVYERPLKAAEDASERLGEMLQVAMLHWKKRGAPADAEPWFERIRRVQPAHEGVLSFYREYKGALHDDVGLAAVLDEAKRSLDEASPERVSLEKELGAHAATQADLQRQIEQYKSALRDAPEDDGIREKLKILYKQTQGHSALVELLRQELERTPEEKYEKRLAIMREIADVYRKYIKSDTALVGVLNQIVQLDDKLDEHDVEEVRELVTLFDKLGRPRDLLASQKLLAEIVPDLEEKKLLYRQVGRRWLDQFSNVQHAMEAFAALHALEPSDEEAIERLDDLYRKRRSWKELFALYETQLLQKKGEARVPLLREMAALAAEHLSRVESALGYYREILDLEPSRLDVLDRYEKHAERSKNWAALADALERRLEATDAAEARLPILQKLGAVYSDHLERADDAVRTWHRVVEAQPGNARAMRVLRDAYLKAGRFDELEALYGEQQDLEGLAEVLSTAADRAREPELKLELSYRAARVYEEGLRQSARAVRSYERILSVQPEDQRAIDRLLPLYEADEKWARVPALLEVKYRLATSDDERVGLLERLFDVASTHLFDRRLSIQYARRAFDLAPKDPRTIEIFDSASRAGGGWEEMLAALEARIAAVGGPLRPLSTIPPAPLAAAATVVELPAVETPTAPGKKKRGAGAKKRGKAKATEPPAPVVEAPAPEPAVVLQAPEPTRTTAPLQALSAENRAERRLLGLRVARVLGEELGRAEEAIHRLKALAGENPDDAEVLDLLESTLRRHASKADLRWLYKHREKRAAAAAEKEAVLLEWAQFEEREAEPKLALDLYQRVLAVAPDSKVALEAVTRLGIEVGDLDVATLALERHRDHAEGKERADKEIELAALYWSAERARDALLAVERALGEGVESGLAIPILQKLVDVPELRADAARILTEQYEAGGDARKESEALRALVSETSDTREKLELIRRLAGVYEDKLAEPGSALSVVLEGLRIAPGDFDLWDRAHELAGASGRPVELADAYRDILAKELDDDTVASLARRAGELHETVLGDSSGAAPYYERVLAVRADDEEAFTRLREILTSAERWQELEQLYDGEIARLGDEGRRIEMLAEVALLAEDVMGDAARAAGYHQRILELEPRYTVSLESLDRIYARSGQKKLLLDVLDRRAELTTGTEFSALQLRIGQIALEEHQPDRAMTAVERVLEDEPGNYEARDVAERLLEIGSVRVRASRALEVVYEAQDEIRELVRVLSVRVEALRPSEESRLSAKELAENESERRELLRRIATLKDDRLHDDVGSFEVFAELSPLDPDDVDLRERLIDSGRRLSRGEEVIRVLLAAEASARAPSVKAEILLQAATVQSDGGDAAAAEATLNRVVAFGTEEPEAALTAARLLEALLVRQNRPKDLVRVLELQTTLESDFERKAELLARVAQIAMDVLDDAALAISAWERRLEDNPDDAEALQNLAELYEKAERFQDLGRVLVLRRDSAKSSEERLRIVRHLADVQERHLADVAGAIESYQTLLDEGGVDQASIKSLVRLFEREKRYEDLAEALERQVDIVPERQEELDALVALGRVRSEHIGEPLRAIEAYRRALGLDERHEASQTALRELLSHEDPVVRLEAAEILEPIYTASRDHEGLLAVLATQADDSDDPTQRARIFERSADIAEESLSSPGRALELAARGIEAAAAVGEVKDWLVRIERLSTAANSRKKQVEILESIAADMYDADERVGVQKRIGEIKRDHLGDTDGAIEAFRAALEIQPDDREALQELEHLYAAKEAFPDLLATLERREETALDDQERKALAYRRAEILAQRMHEPGRAIEVYEAILDGALETPAIKAVEALYVSAQRWDDVVALTERRIDAAERGRASLRVKLARIHFERRSDPERALDELEQALLEENQHEASVEYLETLSTSLDDPLLRARAAKLLEPIYMRRGNFDRVLQVLELRLRASEDTSERRDLVGRISKIHEEQREDYRAALEVTATLLSDDPTDLETLEKLERLAKVAGAPARLAEILEKVALDQDEGDEAGARLARRAAEILEQEGEDERALVLYRRALAFEPADEQLFAGVDRLLAKAGRTVERVSLHQEVLDHRYEPDEQIRLLHAIASLSKDALGQPEAAIEAHQRALSIDDENVVSLDQLTVLFAQVGRYDDLAELYRRRAESLPAEEGSRYRLARAALFVNRLEQPQAALDELEEIVRDLPDNVEAISRIEALRQNELLRARAVEILRPLYEQADDWRKIIRLNEDRFVLAEDAHEKLAILRETAELWEHRGEDAERALRAFAEALRLVPDDEASREDVERLVSVTARWVDLAALYTQILAEHPDLISRPEILRRLVELYDEYLDDPRRGLAWALKLLDIDSSDPWIVDHVLRLSTLLGDWQSVERAIVIKSESSLDEDEQVGLLLRLGELRLGTLDDESGALSAFERVIEIDAKSTLACDRLIDIYEGKDDATKLVELYLLRVEAGDATDELRYSLQRKAAHLFETRLSEPERAIECLTSALIVYPGDSETILELNRLYREQKMWPDLLDNLRLEAGTADTLEKRLAVRHDIARILAKEMESLEDALEAYGVVLDERPDDEEALDAVLSIGRREEHLRARAADLLVPALRQTGLKKRLVEALELRYTTEQDPQTRAETMRAVATVAEVDLANRELALQALLRAVADVPDARDLYDELERLAAATGLWAELADGLEALAVDVFDADTAAGLWVRVGRIREERQNQAQKAISAYQKAAEQVGDRLDLLDALDRLYSARGDTQMVVELLERRMVLADTDEAQAKILTRQGQLLLEQQRSPDEAIVTLRSAVERDVKNRDATALLAKLLDDEKYFDEVFEILDAAFRARSSGVELAGLHQLRVDRAKSREEKLDMRRALAEVLEHECRDTLSAQRALEAALLDDVSNIGVQDDIERLASLSGAWAEAGKTLLEAIERASQLAEHVGRDAALRAALWLRDQARDAVLAEEALTVALSFAPDDDVLLEHLDDLLAIPGREQDRLGTVRRRATVSDGAGKVELLWRAWELATGLGDVATREQVLRDVLAEEPEDVRALELLTELRRAAGDAAETYELIKRRADIEGDADRRRSLRVEAARLAREELGQLDQATTILESIFEESPTDAEAAEALAAAYATGERYGDLDGLYRRLIEQAETSDERSPLTLRLARLRQERFSDTDGAAELLERVLSQEPEHTEAATYLAEIYEGAGKLVELVGLLERRAQTLFGSGAEAEALALQKQAAELAETRLGDLDRAASTWLEVREVEDSEEALEALLRIFTALDQKQEAAAILEALALRSEPEQAAEYWLRLALSRADLGERDGVVKSLDAARALCPEDASLRQRLKQEYEKAGEWRSVAELVLADAEAAREKKTKIDLYREASTLYAERVSDPSRAADVLKLAVDLAPDDRGLLLDLCDAVSLAGRGEESVAILERIVESYGGKRAKELGEIHRRLAHAHLTLGQDDRALVELDKAFRIEPGNIQVLKQLGDLAFKNGDHAKAQQMFRALLLQRLDDKSAISKAQVFCRLGQIHQALNEGSKAKQMFERAIQADPNLQEARDGLAAVG